MRIKWFILLILAAFQMNGRIYFVEVQDRDEWEKFTSMAQGKDRPLFVWFSFGQSFESHFTYETEEDRINSEFLPLVVSDPGLCRDILAELNQRPFPSVLIMNSKKFIGGIESISQDPDMKVSLQGFSEESLRKIREFPTMWQKANDGSLEVGKWEDFLRLAIWNESPGKMEYIIGQLRSTMTDSSLSDTAYWPFMLHYNLYLENPIVRTLKDHPEMVETDVPFPWEEYLLEIFRVNLGQAILRGDSLFMERVILDVDSLGPEELKAPFLAEKTRLTFLRSQEKWKAYLSIWNEIPDTALPYSFYESEVSGLWKVGTPEALETSLVISRKGAEGHPRSFEFAVLLTYSLIENGLTTEALETAYDAFSNAKDQDQKKFIEGLIRSLETPTWDYYEN